MREAAHRTAQLSRRRRILLLSAVLLTAAVVGLWLFRAPLLTALGRSLIVDDGAATADVIFVLNGGPETRPFHAAERYAAGAAPRVLIVQAKPQPAARMGLMPDETSVNVAIMEKRGVPRDAITVLPYGGEGAASTFDEAVALRAYVEAQPVERVLLVTSAFHTRRARWIMRRLLKGTDVTLSVTAAPHWSFNAANWWQREDGLLYFVTEVVKMGFYRLHY
jgi:uncharacterized SAM-binding protein YcdF (DUF218 family)